MNPDWLFFTHPAMENFKGHRKTNYHSGKRFCSLQRAQLRFVPRCAWLGQVIGYGAAQSAQPGRYSLVMGFSWRSGCYGCFGSCGFRLARKSHVFFSWMNPPSCRALWRAGRHQKSRLCSVFNADGAAAQLGQQCKGGNGWDRFLFKILKLHPRTPARIEIGFH